jgi:hypothetical protein
MTAQNEVRFILNTIKSNWPDPSFRSDILRIDEDDPRVLETGKRSASVDLGDAVAIRCSETDRSREPQGTGFNYEVETDLSVTLEAVHESEFGQVSDSTEFRGVVNKTLRAINAARTYPDVQPASDSVGKIEYLDARITDQSTPPEAQAANDYFAEEITVRLRGRKKLP